MWESGGLDFINLNTQGGRDVLVLKLVVKKKEAQKKHKRSTGVGVILGIHFLGVARGWEQEWELEWEQECEWGT